jgi:hypothetical protein
MPTHRMQGEAISLDNEKQATFKISGPGEPLQITMKSIAAVWRANVPSIVRLKH